jgi:hypothetical protein
MSKPIHTHNCAGCSGVWECADKSCTLPVDAGCGHAYNTSCGITPLPEFPDRSDAVKQREFRAARVKAKRNERIGVRNDNGRD